MKLLEFIIGSESAEDLLGFTMRKAYQEGAEWSFREKQAFINQGFEGSTLEGSLAERRVAQLLETLKNHGQIINWVPSDQREALDVFSADFVIERAKDRLLMSLQVTSDGEHGRRRRRGIEAKFGWPAIPVLQNRKKNGNLKNKRSFTKELIRIAGSDDYFTIEKLD